MSERRIECPDCAATVVLVERNLGTGYHPMCCPGCDYIGLSVPEGWDVDFTGTRRVARAEMQEALRITPNDERRRSLREALIATLADEYQKLGGWDAARRSTRERARNTVSNILELTGLDGDVIP